ncbi:hypothetical protein N7457_009581 [Penicillium paradoxum]|uniref:uncharacterized protein n=1 Tax=Penicillium paradoxum TaxID=176176 RepID=UPI0025488084|nr:uncharacterized protein N7457_009581 [Penicillium paradoxum]KAJ5774685.1 hypothetical protein N7457_009581 [Penicillium paradoxum]
MPIQAILPRHPIIVVRQSWNEKERVYIRATDKRSYSFTLTQFHLNNPIPKFKVFQISATMHSLTRSLVSLSLLSSTIHAQTIARVWTHFYPNCPGQPFTNLDTYENYHESSPSQDITVGSCKNFPVPSYERSLVSAISVDAELLSHNHDLPFLEGGSGCNITVHEVPGCIDPPLISQEIRNGVEISQCEPRHFVAYSQVDKTHAPAQKHTQPDTQQAQPTKPEDPMRAEKHTSVEDINNIQMPGSNADSWHLSPTTQNQREPAQESRVNEAGHAESDRIVHKTLELLKNKTSTLVSGKHNASHLHGALHSNGTASGNRTVMSRRRLSVLRNRVARLA